MNQTMQKPMTIDELPAPLQVRALHIIEQEHINPNKVYFEETEDPNYMRMLEAGAETGYGYFIEEQEID